MIAHGLQPTAGPSSIDASLWEPHSRTLIDLDPDRPDDEILHAMAESAQRGWMVVLLGRTLDDQAVLYDPSLGEFHADVGPLEGDGETDRDSDAVARRQGAIPRENPAIFGACNRCGHFQWHSRSGSWACRVCDHYDGNSTLDPMTVHEVDGSTPCTTCAGLLLVAA